MHKILLRNLWLQSQKARRLFWNPLLSLSGSQARWERVCLHSVLHLGLQRGGEQGDLGTPVSDPCCSALAFGMHSPHICFASVSSFKQRAPCLLQAGCQQGASWPQKLSVWMCVVSAHWNLAHTVTPPRAHPPYSIRSHPDSWSESRPKPDFKDSPSFHLLRYHTPFPFAASTPFSSPVSTEPPEWMDLDPPWP